MRILHVLHQYPPEYIGGTELYTKSIAEKQAMAGHDVSIFVPSMRSEDGLQLETENGVSVYRSPGLTPGPTARFASTYRNVGIQSHFEELLAESNPDIVHIQHLMGLPAALTGRLVKRGIPYVLTLHDYWYLCANAQLLTNYDNTVCEGPNWWLNCARCGLARLGYSNLSPLSPMLAPIFAMRNRLTGRALSGAERLIAPTSFVRDLYINSNIDSDKIVVVPHGIDPPAKLPPRKKPTPGTLMIGYIGGLSWQKGIHVLIEAFNHLPEGKATLAIWGDTEAFPAYVNELKQLASHKGISINGLLSREQFWNHLAGLDLVVVPSLWYETASLIIQEAFACKVPVIASDLGALSSRVHNGVDGILVPAGNSSALSAALKKVLDDPEILSHLRSGILPVITTAEHIELLEKLYRSVIGV